MKSKLILNISSLMILVFVLSSAVNAQEGYQRFYASLDRTLINMGNIPTADGGFFMLNLGIETQSQSIDRVQISRNNPKGNLIWTKEYTLIDEVLVTNLKSIDFVRLDNDTLVINGITQVPGVAPEDEKFILKVDSSNGEIIWSGIESDLVDQLAPLTLPIVVDGYNNSVVSYNTHGSITGDTFAIQRIKYNSNNEVISQQAYFPTGIDEPIVLAGLVDAVNTIDSNTVISYIPDLNSASTALLTLDGNGEMLHSVNYSISPDSIVNYQMQTSAIATTQDTGVVMTGFVFQPLTNGISNYIIKTDSIGRILWSKFIDASLSGLISQVNDVITRNNGEIVVSGKYFNVVNLLVGDFMIYFDSDGNVIRQLDYRSDNSFFFLNSPQGIVQFTQGEMGNASDGGILYSTTGFDPIEQQVSPYIVKTDFLGDAMCNDTLDLDMVTDFAFVRDTLTMDLGDYVQTDTLLIRSRDYEGYDAPILTLIDTVYCPQDVIMQTIDASIDGATSYIWSTDETTPSILVTEEGEYSVTVTVGDRICYVQCDTSNITKQDFPEASISPDFSGVCELGEIQLTAGATNNITSLIWSTGETTNSISISNPNTYSVTITDNCDNTSAANIEITDQFETGVTSSVTGGEISCLNGSTQQELQLFINSNFETESILWSSGETSETITGLEAMNYSVTVTNICGETSISMFTVPDLNADIDFNISPSVSNVICNGTNTSVILQANVTSSQSFLVTWSDGTLGNQLEVTEAGTFTATVVNECGDELSQSVDVSIDDLTVAPPMPTINVAADSCDFVLTVMPGIQTNVIGSTPTFIWSTSESSEMITVTSSGLYTVTVSDGCGSTGLAEFNVEEMPDALIFPNIFFPGGTIDNNRSFGPYLKCPQTFNGENYVLEIFNRFGNRVFETNSVTGRWNGSHSGSLAPRDVYMYQFTYDVPGGDSQVGSGSITLMR